MIDAPEASNKAAMKDFNSLAATGPTGEAGPDKISRWDPADSSLQATMGSLPNIHGPSAGHKIPDAQANTFAYLEPHASITALSLEAPIMQTVTTGSATIPEPTQTAKQ